jgi:hypothetical protein
MPNGNQMVVNGSQWMPNGNQMSAKCVTNVELTNGSQMCVKKSSICVKISEFCVNK